jgi:dynein heavy chain
MYNKEQVNWISWTSQVQDYVPAPGMPFHKILVPTADTIRSNWLVGTCFQVARPSIFIGDSGTAKTVTLQHYLSTLSDKNNLLNVSFSSRTSGRDLQVNIESNIEKRIKGTYGKPFLHDI